MTSTNNNNTNNDQDQDVVDDEMPPKIRAAKERWEKENPGKTYRYKKARNEMASIPDLLAHGAEPSKPPTWVEKIGYPLVLVLLFAASFAIFLWVDPVNNSKYPKGRFSLNKMKNRVNPNMQKPTQASTTAEGAADPARILLKKEKHADYRKPDHEEF
eukprot:CAMPEP_0198138276 /NCGR_PEP_ID=MMETSP1443-20131203/1697_1 /TAXON_ID=186043 /ORGANISM="Entomoneis sp., Strain CCMP2396" /LENGTH=157 /DNA_ID=CAMNT_0043799987 /DNA_START=85 /DNA_END=558 /DNA_ORIENTATION=+